MMTPEERQLIQVFGQDLLLNWIAYPTTVSLCYGVLVPIAATVFHHLAQKKVHTWRSRWQLAITFLGLVIFPGLLITEIQIASSGYLFFQPSTIPLLKRLDNINVVTGKWNVVQVWLQLIPPIVNDAFIIWRAWVVFEQRRWASYVSIGLCLSTLSITLVLLGISSNPNVLLTEAMSNSAVQISLSTASSILSFLTNFVATSFIGWTLWTHLKFLKRNIDTQQHQIFKLWHILHLLVDAGAVYGILQLLYTITNAVDFNQLATLIFKDVVALVYFCISIVYPALTIALIHGPFSILGVHQTVNSLQISSLGV